MTSGLKLRRAPRKPLRLLVACSLCKLLLALFSRDEFTHALAFFGSRANPDLHLSLIAWLFLQRPSLHAASNTSLSTKNWVQASREVKLPFNIGT